jgi:hypothetical protein
MLSGTVKRDDTVIALWKQWRKEKREENLPAFSSFSIYY